MCVFLCASVCACVRSWHRISAAKLARVIGDLVQALCFLRGDSVARKAMTRPDKKTSGSCRPVGRHCANHLSSRDIGTGSPIREMSATPAVICLRRPSFLVALRPPASACRPDRAAAALSSGRRWMDDRLVVGCAVRERARYEDGAEWRPSDHV